MPYTSVYRDPQGNVRAELSAQEIQDVFRSGEGLLWVDVSETDHEDARFLEDVFDFHPLAIEDCLNPRYQRPKVDDFGDYIFVMIHGVNHVATEDVVATIELDLFIGKNFVVSNHLFAMPAIEHVGELIQRHPGLLGRGAAMLAHTLMDALIDSLLPTIDQMSEVGDAIEERALHDPRPPVLDAIVRLKRSVLRIHRVMVPEREILHRLSRGDYEVVGKDAALYYRDVYDHVVRIEDVNQTLRERVDNALATYLSSISLRQNETMKTLAVVACIFLPLTLIAGIYGMNFEHMRELSWEWGYYAVLGVMAVIGLSIAGWFWARSWLSAGRRRFTQALEFGVDPVKVRDVLAARVKDTWR